MSDSLTGGKHYAAITRFTIPLLLGNLVQQLYVLADAFIISRTLGVDAFAGVSSTGGLVLLVIGCAQGLTAGLSIPISRSYGAGDHERARKNMYHNVLACGGGTVILTLAGLACIRFLLELLRTPESLKPFAHEYL